MATSYELEPPPSHPAANLGVIVIVIATLAAGAWFYISRRDAGGAVPEATASAETAPSPSPSPSPAAAQLEPAGIAPSPSSQPRGGRADQPRAAVGADNLAPSPSPAPLPASPAPIQAVAQSVGAAPLRAAPPIPASVPEPDPRIYDAATVDVTPPSLLTPIGIAPVRTNYMPGLATIEVIVSGDGSVQSVKAGRTPATLGETLEMMNWLSTAKSWRFGAAVRDGQAVKYRLVVPLSAMVSGRGIR
jgi:hypothetical protein